MHFFFFFKFIFTGTLSETAATGHFTLVLLYQSQKIHLTKMLLPHKAVLNVDVKSLCCSGSSVLLVWCDNRGDRLLQHNRGVDVNVFWLVVVIMEHNKINVMAHIKTPEEQPIVRQTHWSLGNSTIYVGPWPRLWATFTVRGVERRKREQVKLGQNPPPLLA